MNNRRNKAECGGWRVALLEVLRRSRADICATYLDLSLKEADKNARLFTPC